HRAATQGRSTAATVHCTVLNCSYTVDPKAVGTPRLQTRTKTASSPAYAQITAVHAVLLAAITSSRTIVARIMLDPARISADRPHEPRPRVRARALPPSRDRGERRRDRGPVSPVRHSVRPQSWSPCPAPRAATPGIRLSPASQERAEDRRATGP